MNMSEKIWESIKTPLRQGLLFVYSLLINKVLDWIATTIGFNFTEEQRVQIMGFGIPIVWSILSFIDKYVHEVAKAEPAKTRNEGVGGVTGLTGF
jgi:hypothetical protein